jgi:hypothetical protein
MRRLWILLAVAWKELQLISRDRGNLALMFLLPLLLSSMQSAANTSLNEEDGEAAILLRVALVNDDEGVFGPEVVEAIQAIDELEVHVYETLAGAERAVSTGELAAGIYFPRYFSERINAHSPTQVEVIVDPAQPQSASIVTGIMNQVVDEVAIWGEVGYGIRSVLDESGLLEDVGAAERQAIAAQNLGVIMTRLAEMRRSPLISIVSEDLEGLERES